MTGAAIGHGNGGSQPVTGANGGGQPGNGGGQPVTVAAQPGDGTGLTVAARRRLG